MTEVVLHVYDVTSSRSEKANTAVLQINRLFKDHFGIGGIFHGAIEVYGDEWSFGFCEQDSGVFGCQPGQNPMYTYRERIVLGETNLSIIEVRMILRELSHAWPGQSYDPLSKNCNHFCDAFCERLGVPKVPDCASTVWVNRFANAGDSAITAAGNAAEQLRRVKDEIVTAGRVAYDFMASLTTNSQTTPESPSNSNKGRPGTSNQGEWFKKLISVGPRPSTSEAPDETDDDVPLRQQSSQSSNQSEDQNS